MSFDEVVLPLRVGYGSSGGHCFSTEVVVIDNGFERRNQNWSQARRIFDARLGVQSVQDATGLLNFFHARAGMARGFRLQDWSDFSSASDNISAPSFSDQIIAIGDGTTSSFQLKKTYVSGSATHTRLISKPVANSVLIGKDGSQITSGFSVNFTSGIVSFSSPPAKNSHISAGFLFHVPVRFDTDALSLSIDNFATYTAEIPIVEIRI